MSISASTGYLRQVFRPVYTYDSHIDDCHAPDAECFICGEPYSTYTGSGCRALRLNHCNHLIGEACFTEWIRRQPEKCPYWNHHLPNIILHAHPPDEDWSVSLTRAVATTYWFEYCDKLLGVCIVESKTIRLVQKMATNGLSSRKARDIWWLYFGNSFTMMFIAYGTLASLMLASLILFPQLLALALGLKVSFWSQPVLLWILKIVWRASFLNSAVFMFAAERVIKVSFMRSERARKDYLSNRPLTRFRL